MLVRTHFYLQVFMRANFLSLRVNSTDISGWWFGGMPETQVFTCTAGSGPDSSQSPGPVWVSQLSAVPAWTLEGHQEDHFLFYLLASCGFILWESCSVAVRKRTGNILKKSVLNLLKKSVLKPTGVLIYLFSCAA